MESQHFVMLTVVFEIQIPKLKDGATQTVVVVLISREYTITIAKRTVRFQKTMHSGKFEFFVVTVHIIRSYQRLMQKGFKITRHTLCNTTDVTSGAIISYPSGAPEFIRFLVEIVFLDLQFCV
jgi:hypothetical protein